MLKISYIIFIIISLTSRFYAIKSDGVLFQSLPTSSFIETYISDSESFKKSSSQKFVFYVHQRVNKPTHCKTVEFLNAEQMFGNRGPIFHKMDNLYSERLAYYNGHEYLSFANVGEHGTWIVGNTPGEDSGYLYIRPTFTTFTPLGIESTTSWHWNAGGEWKGMNEIKLICRDKDVSTDSFFYEVDSFYNSKELTTSEETGKAFMIPSSDKNKINILFPDRTMKEVYLHSIKVIISKGGIVKLTNQASSKTVVTRLINHELYPERSWRLICRQEPITSIGNTGSDSTTTTQSTSDMLLILDSKSGKFQDSWKVLELKNAEQEALNSKLIQDIEMTNVGDYLWIWTEEVYNIQEKWVDETRTNSYTNYITPDNVNTNEMILLCLSRQDTSQASTWIFRYYPHDRREQMKQTPLERDVELIKITIPRNNTSHASQCTSSTSQCNPSQSGLLSMTLSTTTRHLQEGAEYIQFVLHGLVYIGSNPITYIRNFIADNDKLLGPDMSSCYFYHAAVSLPTPFIYAAELVCVLEGAKSLTMVSIQLSLFFLFKY